MIRACKSPRPLPRKTDLRPSARIRICAAAILTLIFCAAFPRIFAQAPKPPSAPPSAATQSKLDGARLVVTGDVANPLSLSLTDLGSFPRQILKVTNEHDGKQEIYEGALLADILKRAGVPQGSDLRGPALATHVRANAEDGYSVVFSLAELDSGIGDSGALVADTLDGQPIPDKLGPLRLIVPHDKRPARWVRMLRTITVVKPSK
jgi:DMSO/TMAO reductase YedYZ molybdopterin-dependent catalytic subunit